MNLSTENIILKLCVGCVLAALQLPSITFAESAVPNALFVSDVVFGEEPHASVLGVSTDQPLSVEQRAAMLRQIETLVAIVNALKQQLALQKGIIVQPTTAVTGFQTYKTTDYATRLLDSAIVPSGTDGDTIDDNTLTVMFKVEITNLNTDKALLIDRTSFNVALKTSGMSNVRAQTITRPKLNFTPGISYGTDVRNTPYIMIAPGQRESIELIENLRVTEPGVYQGFLQRPTYLLDTVEFDKETLSFSKNGAPFKPTVGGGWIQFASDVKTNQFVSSFLDRIASDNVVKLSTFDKPEFDFVFRYPSEFQVSGSNGEYEFTYNGNLIIKIMKENELPNLDKLTKLSEELVLSWPSKITNFSYSFNDKVIGSGNLSIIDAGGFVMQGYAYTDNSRNFSAYPALAAVSQTLLNRIK